MVIFEIREHTQTRISTQKVGNFKMESKFLLNENNANLWKFIKTYQRYLNKELDGWAYYKFMDIMKSLKAENKQLNELIIDNNFLSFFVHYWENGRQKW